MARLEVITGPMFSKKSTRLIEALDDETHADKTILLLKPAASATSYQNCQVLNKNEMVSKLLS